MATNQAQQILQALAAQGYSDGELADASGIHRVTICRIRNGQLSGARALPTLRDLAQTIQGQGIHLGLDLSAAATPAASSGTRSSSSAAPRGTPTAAQRTQQQQRRTAAQPTEEESSSGLGWVALGVGGLVLGGLAALGWRARRDSTLQGPIQPEQQQQQQQLSPEQQQLYQQLLQRYQQMGYPQQQPGDQPGYQQ